MLKSAIFDRNSRVTLFGVVNISPSEPLIDRWQAKVDQVVSSKHRRLKKEVDNAITEHAQIFIRNTFLKQQAGNTLTNNDR